MLKRLIPFALAGALSLCLMSPAGAAQGTGCMPTTGTVSGLTFAQDVNSAIAALISSNSGASAPATDCTALAIKGQVWLDTSVTPNAFRQYDGVSTWVTIGYLDATSHLFSPPIGGGVSSIASASTTDLGSLASAAVTITGTTSIVSFGSSAVIGTIRSLTFAGSLTLTYNVTSMILPGGANIVTQAGDTALAQYLGSGNWRVLSYTPAAIPTKGSPTSSDLVLLQDAANNNTPSKTLLSAILALVPTPPAVAGAQGLVVTNNAGTPNSVIDVTADQAVMLTSGNAPIYASSISLSINTGITGANALDIGARAINTWYNVYLISNGSTTAGLASLSATAPTMPGGYTYKVRIAAMRTDGSGNFLRTRQLGSETQFTITGSTNTAAMPQLSSGTAGSVSAPTWVPLAWANFAPPTAVRITVVGTLPNSNGGLMIAPNNAYGASSSITNPPPCVANGTGATVLNLSIQCSLGIESANIYWASTANNSIVSVLGWRDKVNAN